MSYLFLDMDGTLYSPKLGDIPGSALLALKKAREKGHKVFLCTGRSLAEASAYLHYDVDGFILGAGGMVYADGNCILDTPMKSEDVTKMKRMIQEGGAGYCLEGAAGAYASEKGYQSLLWYFSGGNEDSVYRKQKMDENCTYTEEHGDENCDAIYKLCAFHTEWEPFYPELEKKLEYPYVLTKAMELKEDHFCIGEITDGRVTKATGIEAVLKYYQADSDEAYGFGDSANDLPMFRICGTSAAMGNATPETKEEASYITTDILEDGIYNAFLHFGLID